MNYIRTKNLSKNESITSYYAPRTLPKKIGKFFIEGFVEEKCNSTWITQKYCETHGIPFKINKLKSHFTTMVQDYRSAFMIVEVFYYDSKNYSEKFTDCAFRGATNIKFDYMISMSEFDYSDIFKDYEKEILSSLIEGFDSVSTDKAFKLDKFRIHLNFVNRIPQDVENENILKIEDVLDEEDILGNKNIFDDKNLKIENTKNENDE